MPSWRWGGGWTRDDELFNSAGKGRGIVTVKRVACFAASLKHGGFCYAGKDLDTEEWVRPVSDDPGHAISAYYRVVGKGDPAKVGDVLQMTLGEPVGADWQTENWQHRPVHWRRIGEMSFDQVRGSIDQPDSIWGRGRSTHWGTHDELSEADAMTFDHSLLLVEVRDLVVLSRDEGYETAKRRTRAQFSYGGIDYQLAITDPEHFNYAMGEHPIGHALLCCSLAEAYPWADGSRHVSKLVAAIITRERLG